MTWVKLDDGFPDDPKIEGLSDAAFRVYVTGLCRAARKLTDGHLSPRDVKVVGVTAGKTKPERYVGELVDRGLWQLNGDGYEINKFLEYNQSADEVRELRRKRAEAGRRGGQAKGQANA